MKLTGTIRVDVQAESPEACDFLLKSIVRGIHPHRVGYTSNKRGQVSAARVLSTSITRVRPAAKPKKRGAR